MTDANTDMLVFAAEDPVESLRHGAARAPWKIMLVDDEEEVHQVTRVALRTFSFEGRRLEFVSAYSGEQARRILPEHPDTAVILLDVVMEEDDAGLKVARFVREEHGNRMARIVLRTGQPGQAPEPRVIVEYDIHDYKNKTEESRARIERALERETAYARAAARFVPHDLLRLLERDSIVETRLGENADRVVGLLVSDIRDFTSMTEKMTPQENFDFINEYLDRTGPIIRRHGGFVVKYIGDGIMAAFPSGPDDAVDAAVATLRAVSAYNAERRGADRPALQVGVAVHVGAVRLGIVGEPDRMQGDLFSDHVNLTSRLEGLTKEYRSPLLVSDAVVASLRDPSRLHLRGLGSAKLRGKEKTVGVYECFDADPPEVAAKKRETRALFERAIALFDAGDRQQAALVFEQVLRENPDDAAAASFARRCT
jgi:adenylate cyclase